MKMQSLDVTGSNIKKIRELFPHCVTEGQYDSDIFTANKREDLSKSFPASKHITDYVFTDGMSDNSVEMKFAKALEAAKIDCAKKLFNEMSDSDVRYHEVNSYKTLLEVMQTL